MQDRIPGTCLSYTEVYIMRKSRRVNEYDGVTVVETSEYKSRRPRKQARRENATDKLDRGKAKVFDKTKPSA